MQSFAPVKKVIINYRLSRSGYRVNKKTADQHGDWLAVNFYLVGAARFELTASCTRNKRATKLRYAPT